MQFLLFSSLLLLFVLGALLSIHILLETVRIVLDLE